MKAVLANLGFILQTTGILILLAVPVGFIYNEQPAIISFFITSVVFLGSGFFMNSLSQRRHLDFKSSCILISLTFLLMGIVGAIPFLYTNVFAGSGVFSRVINSIFESVSGYTTTGFSMITDVDSLPRSMVFYRGLTQWIGGIGVVFVVLVFFNSRHSLDYIGKAIGFEKMTTTMRKSYVAVFLIYLAYTIIFFGILYGFGIRDWVDNISLVFATIATGGFSPVNDISTLTTFPNGVFLVLLMILGATSFLVHYRLFTGKFRKAFNTELIVLVVIIIAGAFIFSLASEESIAKSFFHVTSASSTTGFSLSNLGELAPNAKMLLFTLMFIGGCASSTAGGVRIISILVLIKSIPWAIKSIITGIPNTFTLEEKEYSSSDVMSYLLTIILAVAVIALFAFIFTFFGYTLVDSVFEVVSAFANTGLSVGIASVSTPGILKIILILTMLIGRVGIVAFLVALIPGLRKEAVQLKSEPVSVAG